MREELLLFSPYVDKLPEFEQELYDHFVIKGLNQITLARYIGITQGAVSSRLSRILRRLKYLKILEDFDVNNLVDKFADILGPLEIELIKTLAHTSSQSATAELLNDQFNLIGHRVMNQIKVRHRFFKCLGRIKSLEDGKYKKLLSLLNLIKDNFYILHEVKLPQFHHGGL